MEVWPEGSHTKPDGACAGHLPLKCMLYTTMRKVLGFLVVLCVAVDIVVGALFVAVFGYGYNGYNCCQSDCCHQQW